MKKVLIPLMIIQVLLFAIGIWQLSEGKLFFGLFNVVLNTAFFVVNIYTLKRVSDG